LNEFGEEIGVPGKHDIGGTMKGEDEIKQIHSVNSPNQPPPGLNGAKNDEIGDQLKKDKEEKKMKCGDCFGAQEVDGQVVSQFNSIGFFWLFD